MLVSGEQDVLRSVMCQIIILQQNNNPPSREHRNERQREWIRVSHRVCSGQIYPQTPCSSAEEKHKNIRPASRKDTERKGGRKGRGKKKKNQTFQYPTHPLGEMKSRQRCVEIMQTRDTQGGPTWRHLSDWALITACFLSFTQRQMLTWDPLLELFTHFTHNKRNKSKETTGWQLTGSGSLPPCHDALISWMIRPVACMCVSCTPCTPEGRRVICY